MQMKQVVLALAATGVLSSQALAVEGWDAEAPGVQPVQVALVGPATALPEQVVLVEQEPTAQVAELAAKLPAELPKLPAALAVAEPVPFSAADMQALFVPSTEPLRVAVLSAQEMEETQGGGTFSGRWADAWGPAGADRIHSAWTQPGYFSRWCGCQQPSHSECTTKPLGWLTVIYYREKCWNHSVRWKQCQCRNQPLRSDSVGMGEKFCWATLRIWILSSVVFHASNCCWSLEFRMPYGLVG